MTAKQKLKELQESLCAALNACEEDEALKIQAQIDSLERKLGICSECG